MYIFFRRHYLFLALVLVPTVLAVIYYGLIASDVFISESHFLLRTPQRPVSNGLVGQLLQSSGLSHSQDDTYSVKDYILSRDALKQLDDKLGLRQAFSTGSIDFINRFPGLSWNKSFEQFYKYYGKHVGIEYDPVTSISKLTVRAFTADYAYKINGLLMDMSEQFVNTLNDRSRQDLIHFADSEVKIASDKVKDASLALLTYRSTHSIFEPDRQAAIQLESVAKIQQDLVSTEAEISQLVKLSPDNPQISYLRNRAQALRDAITAEASKVTGARESFSSRAPEFERLALDVEFADKQLGVALAELETARSEAQQKQMYLERLVQPNKPDFPLEPRRFRSVLTTFLLGLIAWGVLVMFIASIREHSD